MNKKNSVILTLKRDALMYDIENCAYIEGNVLATTDTHGKHQVIDVGQDGNADRVTRILDQAFAECVEFMYPYTKQQCESVSVLDNSFVETPEYVVRLEVDVDMSQTTLSLVSKLVHEYMVSRVLGEWLSITLPEASAKWMMKAEDTKNQIRVRLNARCGRVRRTLSPF